MDEALIQEVFRRTDDHRSFKAGQAIFKQGEPGHLMFILVEGIVEVLVGESPIGAFEPIEVFGEMAVIDAGPRSATVVAKTDCKLVAVNQSRFLFLIQQKPQLAIHIMRMLVERIRWMNAASFTQAEDGAPGEQLQPETPSSEPAAAASTGETSTVETPEPSNPGAAA